MDKGTLVLVKVATSFRLGFVAEHHVVKTERMERTFMRVYFPNQHQPPQKRGTKLEDFNTNELRLSERKAWHREWFRGDQCMEVAAYGDW